MRSTRRVAVLSADYKKAYPVLVSLKRHGYTTIAVFSNWRSYVFSRYADKRVRVKRIRSVRDMEVLLNYLKYVYDVDIVIPISFEDYLYISYVENVPIKVPNVRNVAQASDKFELCKICREIGVNYPNTILLEIDDVKECARKLEDTIGYPMVVKGRGDAARPLYVSDIDDLLMILESNIGRELLAQEYVPGIGCGYFAIAVEGKPVIEYTHIRLIEEKASGGPSVASRLDFDVELIEVGRRFLEYFKWTGPVMVEMKRHVETGDIYVIEVNPKFWGSLELSYASGLDLPCELLRICGEDIKCTHNAHKGNVFTWIIAAMHYLRDNAWLYLKMLRRVIERGIINTSDIHLNDPPELFYGGITRMIAVLSGKFSRSNWRNIYNSILIRKLAKIVKFTRLLILDLDGTLVNIPINWMKLKEELCRNRGRSRTYNIMSLIAKYRDLEKDIRKVEVEACKKVKIPENTLRMLNILRKNRLKIALATKQSRDAVYLILENSRAENIFDLIVTRDDALLKQTQISEILRQLNEEPNRTVMIGDSIVDYYAACRNRTRFIAVTESKYRMQMFTELNVPCVANLKILLKMLLDLLGKNVHSINT